MTIVSDFHNHVVRSSALQMAQAAQAKGLQVLGLAEHVFQMEEARAPLAHMPLEGPMHTFAGYSEQVQKVAHDTGLDVRLGLEVDFIPGKNEQIQASLQAYPWDFLIGSIHQVDDIRFENGVYRSREEGEVCWLRYFALLRKAVTSGYFSVVSHPVRMRRKNPYLPPNYREELERLAAEATRCNVALELNGYDVLRYPELVTQLALACARQQTPISVGSDAHIPKEVAQAHKQTEEIMRNAGISQVRIWRQRMEEAYSIV